MGEERFACLTLASVERIGIVRGPVVRADMDFGTTVAGAGSRALYLGAGVALGG